MKRALIALCVCAVAAVAYAAPHRDYGTVLSQSGTCTTSYAGGSSKAASNSETRLALFLTVTKAASGSSMTSATFKVQVSYDGTNWLDVGSTQNDSSLTTQIEHAITAPSAGQSARAALQTESFSPAKYWRVAAKVAGGACVSGDILQVRAVAQ